MCQKHVQKVQNNKKIFFFENFWKMIFCIFLQKKCHKGRFWRFWHFFALFLKNFQNFNFFQKLCFRAILCQKHVQKGQNSKKIFFCWKFLKNKFLSFFAFFLKNFQKIWNFNFFKNLCTKAILCQKHVQKYQKNKKIFFYWKFLKILIFQFF